MINMSTVPFFLTGATEMLAGPDCRADIYAFYDTFFPVDLRTSYIWFSFGKLLSP